MVAQSAGSGAGPDPHRRPGPFRHGHALAGAAQPQDVAEALQLYLARFPKSAALAESAQATTASSTGPCCSPPLAGTSSSAYCSPNWPCQAGSSGQRSC
jgi:hypothetical protein